MQDVCPGVAGFRAATARVSGVPRLEPLPDHDDVPERREGDEEERGWVLEMAFEPRKRSRFSRAASQFLQSARSFFGARQPACKLETGCRAANAASFVQAVAVVHGHTFFAVRRARCLYFPGASLDNRCRRPGSRGARSLRHRGKAMKRTVQLCSSIVIWVLVGACSDEPSSGSAAPSATSAAGAAASPSGGSE